MYIVFFKQKTAYEMRISDWSSDVCSSDLRSGPCGATPSSQQATHLIEGDRILRPEGEQSRPVEASVVIAPLQNRPSRCRELPLDGGPAVFRMFVERPGKQGSGERRRTPDRKSTRLNSSH